MAVMPLLKEGHWSFYIILAQGSNLVLLKLLVEIRYRRSFDGL
jgi:hypothetical protein